MRRLISSFDLLFLLGLDIFMVLSNTSILTVLAVLTMPLLLAAVYHTCIVIVKPFENSIPLVKQAGLASDNFSPKLFWGRRCVELVWSGVCYAVLLWQSQRIAAYSQYIVACVTFALIVSVVAYPMFRRILRR